MSTWITPAGSIGQFTQGQSVSFVFQATSTLGGAIRYVLSNNSLLPPGLSLDSTTGQLTGIPSYVPINTVFTFQVSATETTTSGSIIPNIREFSIDITTLIWETPAGNIGIFGENIPLVYQFTAIPSQSTNVVKYTLLNGNLPRGKTQPLNLSTIGMLTGIPAETSRAETSIFTIRAQEYKPSNLNTPIGFRDRTFSMTVDLGITAPEFITTPGALFTVSDSIWTTYQVKYDNPDPGTTAVITVAIGELPPGLEINSTGLIRGYATPPVNGQSQTYEFTLQVQSESGLGIATYSITVVNQESIPGFIGRSPTIFNTRPPSFVIPSDDPYEAYYLTSNSLGEYTQENNFIFKIIGHDFDNINDLVYVVNGLESIGISNNQTTGWQSGQLPMIGDDIETYNFTARVYKRSNPLLTSETFLFSVTVIGDIITNIEWTTQSDLGVINNGQISDFSISAISDERVALQYRIIGTEISSDLKTIIGTGAEFQTFGDLGAYVTGSADGQDWTNQPSFTGSISTLYFTDSIYSQLTQNVILVGYNQLNNPVIGQLTPSNQYFASAVITTTPIRGVIENLGIFVAVGDNGVILTTSDPSNWSVIRNSGTVNNLNSISQKSGKFVAVGDLGTVLVSTDLITWSIKNSNTITNLRGIVAPATRPGSRYVAVGDLGTILLSLDGNIWEQSKNLIFDANLKSVAVNDTGSVLLAVGDGGTIVRSTDNGINWQYVFNSISTTNLYGIYYDSNTNSFYIVGDGGTILTYSVIEEKLTSPTLTQLPPDLILLPTGDISGRLAFESTNQVVAQNTQRTYRFTVQAYSTRFPQINDSKIFTLTTNQEFYLPYDNIYIRALVDIQDRSKISQLLNNENIIPTSSLYRPLDPYYGKSSGVRYQHQFGVPSVATDDFYSRYIEAVNINHYWRNITLGEIRTAVATDDNNVPIYEVVYSEVQDDLINPQGESISKQIIWPRDIPLNLNDWYTSRSDVFDSYTWYDQYPTVKKTVISSTSSNVITLNNINNLTINMNVTVPVGHVISNNSDGTPPRITSIDPVSNTVTLNVAQTFSSQTQLLFNDPVYTSLTPGVARVLYPDSLPNMRQQIYDSIGQVNSTNLLPRWMTSLQIDGKILGYTPAWVICYCKPGTSAAIKQNILSKWPYTLNQIDFELDRFEVDRSKTYNYQGVNQLGLPQWGTLPSAQPNVIGNSRDSYVYFPRQTILPSDSQ